MASYRAAIYRDPYSGEETVLTGPASAYASEDNLVEAALVEAHQLGLIGEEPPMVPELVLRENLYIGAARTTATSRD
jgi:hypothetical protein